MLALAKAAGQRKTRDHGPRVCCSAGCLDLRDAGQTAACSLPLEVEQIPLVLEQEIMLLAAGRTS